MKHKFLHYFLFVPHFLILDAGPCVSRLKNQVVIPISEEQSLQQNEQYSQLLAFTQRHIAKQQEKSKSPDWKGSVCTHDWIKKQKKLYAYCKPDQKIKYADLKKDVHGLICEFAGLEIPLVRSKYSGFLSYSFLQKAIYNEDCDMIQILVALGVDVNEMRYSSDRTLLYDIILQYRSTVRYSYSGSIIAEPKKVKYSALFKYLLVHGADPNKRNKYFYQIEHTPLHLAATSLRAMHFLQDLLKLPNIDLDVQDSRNRTALDEAKYLAMRPYVTLDQRKYYYKVCELLEKAGASSSVVLEPMPSDEHMEHEFAHSQNRFLSCSY